MSHPRKSATSYLCIPKANFKFWCYNLWIFGKCLITPYNHPYKSYWTLIHSRVTFTFKHALQGSQKVSHNQESSLNRVKNR